MNSYIIDSNFFIQAHRATYPFDVVPSFWTKVKDLAAQGSIISIDKVRDEIFKNDDELTSWCQTNLPDNFFKDSSIAIHNYSDLVTWANSKSDHYSAKAIDDFLETASADAWLISFALNQNLPLLTHEKSEPTRKNRVKIPDVCKAFGLSYSDTVGMLRNLNETI